jgi:hypothetical protein
MLASLAQAFWFFLPPIWWIRARMLLDHEFLADRHAALGFGAPETYASSLLELATSRRGEAMPAATPARAKAPRANAAGSAGSPLFQRILILLHCPFRVEPHHPTWWRWPTPVLILIVTPVVACLCLDLGTRNLQPTPALTARPHSFRMPRLAIAPQNPGRRGRAPVYTLPFDLPAHFDLALDVWGDLASLAQCRIIGQRLTLHRADLASDTSRGAETWHQVQLQRSPSGVALRIDGQAIPLGPISDPVATRLTIEPAPGRPFELRNLCLTW